MSENSPKFKNLSTFRVKYHSKKFREHFPDFLEWNLMQHKWKVAVFFVEVIVKILWLEVTIVNDSLELKVNSDYIDWMFRSIKYRVNIYVIVKIYEIHSSALSENIHSTIQKE